MRPILVLLASRYGDRYHEDVQKTAVTLELIHMASLVHDDVIDDSDIRRGEQTVKARWNNRIAMYTGDFMFSKALKVAAEIEHPQIHQILSYTMKEISLGEIKQIEDQYNWNQNIRNYLLRIKRKTALLLAVSCQLGALAAGASVAICRDLYYFGYYMGMSYQIIDDVLDFVSTEEELGKPVASDIRQGNVTLPTLMAFQNHRVAEQLIRLLEIPEKTPEDWSKVIQLIKESGSIAEAEAISTRFINKAYRILERMPHAKVTKQMERIADYMSKRKY
ncbi:heptaprenyl diphosphate synthase component 2 [Pullulanibacillus camelliae]|uniref:Heptaprenyl diphosphate synthase component 2 n=2 Tax=Pullulanibacillus camelliae TaxID=1707096 RepID=A0A8J2VXY1_9BACL|nr:heptaprenyl diphosphate synthase component 2 [Pullulanibacillus camelliae]